MTCDLSEDVSMVHSSAHMHICIHTACSSNCIACSSRPEKRHPIHTHQPADILNQVGTIPGTCGQVPDVRERISSSACGPTCSLLKAKTVFQVSTGDGGLAFEDVRDVIQQCLCLLQEAVRSPSAKVRDFATTSLLPSLLPIAGAMPDACTLIFSGVMEALELLSASSDIGAASSPRAPHWQFDILASIAVHIPLLFH